MPSKPTVACLGSVFATAFVKQFFSEILEKQKELTAFFNGKPEWKL
jgi:hypothetical protein